MSNSKYRFVMDWGDCSKPFRAYFTGLNLTGALTKKIVISKHPQEGATSILLTLDVVDDGTPGPAGSGVRFDWDDPTKTKVLDPGVYRWDFVATFASPPSPIYRPDVPGDWCVVGVVGGGA